MKKIIIILGVLVVVLVAYFLNVRVSQLKHDRDTYKRNNAVLLNDVKYYRALDSLNAACVGVLELELSEYKKLKNREVQNVTSAQMESITKLNGNVRDSIVYLPGDTTTIVLECVDISDPWFSLNGCATPDGKFTGTFINRDSILIVETIEYKRFLNFLWKTKKIKNRDFRIVSRNPHTKILGFEVVAIKK